MTIRSHTLTSKQEGDALVTALIVWGLHGDARLQKDRSLRPMSQLRQGASKPRKSERSKMTSSGFEWR